MAVSTFILGVAAGLNLCPPFVAAASRAVGLGALGGALYFIAFFVGTSVWALLFVVAPALKRKAPEMKKVARITMLMLGAYFLVVLGPSRMELIMEKIARGNTTPSRIVAASLATAAFAYEAWFFNAAGSSGPDFVGGIVWALFCTAVFGTIALRGRPGEARTIFFSSFSAGFRAVFHRSSY